MEIVTPMEICAGLMQVISYIAADCNWKDLKKIIAEICIIFKSNELKQEIIGMSIYQCHDDPKRSI